MQPRNARPTTRHSSVVLYGCRRRCTGLVVEDLGLRHTAGMHQHHRHDGGSKNELANAIIVSEVSPRFSSSRVFSDSF